MKRTALIIISFMALISIASASSLTLGSISYSSSVLKDESFTVSTSIEASSVSSTITVTVTLTDNTNGVTITSAQKTITFTSDGTQNVQWSLKANNPGTYTNPFTVTATASDGGAATKTATTSLSIQDRPVLEVEVSQNTTTVLPEGYVRLEYVIKNVASADAASATNINALLTLPAGWTVVTSNQYNISSLSSGGAQSSGYFIVKAPSASSLSISSTSSFTISVTSAQGDSITGSYSVQVSSGDAGNTGSTTSSGGGGGGGGGASTENASNIEVREKYDLHIFKDRVTSYAFTNWSNPVLFVNITGNVNAGEITTTVEVLKNTSSLAKSAAPGIVYRNLNIWAGTSGFAVPKNIKEAAIAFRVENSWLSSSNLAGSDVKLLKWDGSQWVQLETSEKTKNASFTYFEAKSDSFSSFAIAGLKGVAVPTATPAVQVTETAISTASATAAPTAAPTKKAQGFEAITAFIAIALLAASLIKERRR